MTPQLAASQTAPILRKERMVDAYRSMYRIRRFEEVCLDLHRQGLIRGSIHLGNGQEAVAVGACLALQPDDWVAITYRSHAQCMAKGISAGPLLAEMLGRADGVCRGKGGSMHLGDMTKGVIPANAIVGAGLPIATGVALSVQLDTAPQVVVAFHGDGALNQGSWHEATRFGGLGGELAATIQELAFDDLDAPIGRVGAEFVPIPYAAPLEGQILPDAARIGAALHHLWS